MTKERVELLAFFTVLFLLFVAIAQADIYVLKDKTTNEVIMVSEKNNYILNDDTLEVVTLPKDLLFYGLEEDYTLYLLKNKKFSLNTIKITEIEDKKTAEKAKKDKFDAAKVTAKEKLLGLGFTKDEVDYILR